MRYLTPERVKSMPISMQIIKAIKDKYGVPTRAFADTIHGIECSAIFVEGLDATFDDLHELANQFRTKEMIDDDWEAEYDSCMIHRIKAGDYKNVDVFITSLFEEV